MIEYIVYTSIVWLALIVIYIIFLRNETSFKYNRIFLLSSLILGLILPVLPRFPTVHFNAIEKVINPIQFSLPEIIVGSQNNSFEQSPMFSFNYILPLIYLIGVLFFTIKLLKSIYAIKKLYNFGEKIKLKDYTLIIIDNDIPTFSFLKYVFISKMLYKSTEKEKILMHEYFHVNQNHSIDILFTEILKIILWFNPIVYIYSFFIKEIHEFDADNSVIKNISKKVYSELLINQLQIAVQYNLANYFINSLIKNRIKMMYKAKTKNKWKYFITIPVIILLTIIINSCQYGNTETTEKTEKAVVPPPPPPEPKDFDSPVPPPPPKPHNIYDENEIYSIVEEMPRFPGCESETSKEEKQKCSFEKLYQYIYKNLEYPKKAQEEGIQGKVTIRFVINKEGYIVNSTILKNIGGGCGEAALEIVNNMNKLQERWTPGKQNGNTVNVFMTLPVVFKLTD